MRLPQSVWLPGQDIREYLLDHQELLDGLWVLVSSIDSCSDVAGLATVRRLIAEGAVKPLSEDPFFAPTSSLHAMLEDRQFFNGFDELWFFDEAVPPAPAPGYIVAPFCAGDVALTDEQVEWIIASECVCGLGDGDGLNVVLGPRSGRFPGLSEFGAFGH